MAVKLNRQILGAFKRNGQLSLDSEGLKLISSALVSLTDERAALYLSSIISSVKVFFLASSIQGRRICFRKIVN